MKLWWVLAWDQYYPAPRLGNVRGQFELEEDALDYADALEKEDFYDYIEVINIEDYL